MVHSRPVLVTLVLVSLCTQPSPGLAMEPETVSPRLIPLLLSPHAEMEDDFQTEIVDINPVAAEFAQLSGQSQPEAKLAAMAYLGLQPNQLVPRGAIRKSQQIHPGVFEVTATREFLDMLPHAMEGLRHGKKQIAVEVKFITLEETEIADLQDALPRGWQVRPSGELVPDHDELDASPLKPGAHGSRENPPVRVAADRSRNFATALSQVSQPLPVQLAVLQTQEAMPIVELARHKTRVDVLHAPKITLFPGQTGTVEEVSQRPFVISVAPVEGEHGTVLQPVIQVLKDGFTVEFVPTIEGEDVRLEGILTLSRIGDVDTFTFKHDAVEEDVTVQLPQHAVRVLRLSQTLEDGSSLLVDPNFTDETTSRGIFGIERTRREHVLLLLTVNILQE